MDAVQLARWTRFAAKGGIGKCSAATDCVAQRVEDLMFFKGDEIVVLMKIKGDDEVYLGSCEGVIGRFKGEDVSFHTKLKRPVITRRTTSPDLAISTTITPDIQLTSPLQIVKKSPTSPAAQDSYSTYNDDSDGEVGIGLSLLQNLGGGDSDDESFMERASVNHDDTCTAEGLMYDEDEGIHTPRPVQFPTHSPSPPTSPTSLSPPANQDSFPESIRRPSLASSASWDGAGDIYDDYRYSRASLASALALRTTGSRVSSSSKLSVSVMRDQWDGHVYDQPPPIPESRPSIDSVMAGVRASFDSKHSSRKSSESGKSLQKKKSMDSAKHSSDSESRKSRQELHFPHPPTNLNVQPELLDKVTRENLRRTSEASRSRSLADFRLSVDSDASIYSRLSDQDSIHKSDSAPQSPVQHIPLPPPLDLVNHNDRSPLLHATWGSPLMSPTNSSFTESPTTSIFMPNPYGSLAAGMASALRQKMETGKRPTLEQQSPDVTANIVVDDDEEIPSGVVQESLTIDSGYSTDTIADSSMDTIILPESLQNSPSPLPPPTIPPDDPPASPIVPVHPPPESSHPPSHLRPTLAQLREGGGAIIPGTQQRRSLFLPHPNAPKPPPLLSPGPMYVAAAHNPPTVPLVSPPVIPVQQVIHMALSSTPPAALLPRMPSKGPTIYGRTEVDMMYATGPIPIVFSVEPPPTTPHPPRITSPPSTPLANTFPSRTATPEVEPSASPIPRQNFLPKKPGMRPRSRSFSAFDSQPQIDVWLGFSSREDTEMQMSRDVPASLRPSIRGVSTTALQSPQQPKPLKSSPLRPSPLSLPHHHTNSASGSRLHPPSLPRSPPSPLAQSSTLFSISAPTTVPSSPTVSISSLRPLHHVNSRSTLNEVVTSKPMFSITAPPSSSPPSPARSRTDSIIHSVQSRDNIPPPSPLNLKDHFSSTTTIDSESGSLRSMVSIPTTTSLMVRNPSIRTKLSLPNLKRHRSKNSISASGLDNGSDMGSGNGNGGTSTVQVEDLDFELVRPSIAQLQQARDSEDSVVLGGGRSGSLDGLTMSMRPESPASYVSPKSPSGNGDGVVRWPRPSFSSINTGISQSILEGPGTGGDVDAHRQRETKWMGLIGSLPPNQWRKNKKVKKLLREGVPSSVRYLVWSSLTDGKAKIANKVYEQLGLRERKREVEGVIEEDVKSCFGLDAMDSEMEKEKERESLRAGQVVKLLHAYLNMVPDVKYTVGLTLIAGQLLLLAPEEEAFWIFVSVMNSHLRPYFSNNTMGLDVDSSLFGRVLESNDPQVAKKMFVNMGISPISFCMTWFTTLFVGTLPPAYVNRVWDLFLYDGIPFLFRVGIAITICCRRQILESTSEATVLEYLKHPLEAWLPETPDAFISMVYSVKLKDEDVRKMRIKLEALVKSGSGGGHQRGLFGFGNGGASASLNGSGNGLTIGHAGHDKSSISLPRT